MRKAAQRAQGDHAVEAGDEGTHCLALAVRDKSEAYLTQMFGTHGWMLLPDVRALPERFVSVATSFLRS